MISSSIAPGSGNRPRRISGIPDTDDQIFEFIDAGCLPRRNHGRRVELIHDRRAGEKMPDIEPFALIHRTIQHHAAQSGRGGFRRRASLSARPSLRNPGKRNRRQAADATNPEGDDLNRLIGRDMAEQPAVRFVEMSRASLAMLSRSSARRTEWSVRIPVRHSADPASVRA